MHAIVRCMEIIGEAANQLSPETRELMAAVPWRGIISMRNRLVHAYFDINLDIVWEGVRNDLPALLEEVLRVIAEHPEDSAAE